MAKIGSETLLKLFPLFLLPNWRMSNVAQRTLGHAHYVAKEIGHFTAQTTVCVVNTNESQHTNPSLEPREFVNVDQEVLGNIFRHRHPGLTNRPVIILGARAFSAAVLVDRLLESAL